MTSSPQGHQDPTDNLNPKPAAARSLKAYAILAVLPLAGVGYLGTQLALTMSPERSESRSVMDLADIPVPRERLATAAAASGDDEIANAPALNPATIVPLRASQGVTNSTASLFPGFLPGLLAPSLRRDDPIGAYVAELGVQPSSVAYEVQVGDTLFGVFDKLNVAGSDAQAAVDALKAAKIDREIRVMRPGQPMTLALGGTLREDDARPLLGCAIKLDPERRLEIARDLSGAYTAQVVSAPLTEERQLARGVITSSLAGAASSEGVSNFIIARFAEIYSYDVDFQRDIHPDDTFEIYYSEYMTEDGEAAPTRGEILFARLAFNGKVKTYYRYTSADGKTTDYYDENGKSARTFLMRTPIDGARISSGFGMRHHPVLGYNKMHKGVDFAAPTGTRVYAAGAGTIELAGRNGSYGNYVRIRHDNGYKTAYAHLSRFAKGIRAGSRVTQGQVIAFVGATGRATGPHLHYEVLQAGHQVNPMSVKVPTGIKLAGAELDRFRSRVNEIDLAMKEDPASQVASAAPSASGAGGQASIPALRAR